MNFNRIQMLRNKPIQVAREINDVYLEVQPPSIGDIYEDNKLFLMTQMLMMKERELKDFLKIAQKNVNKFEMLSLLITQEDDENQLLSKFKKIVLDVSIRKDKIFIGEHPLKPIELDRIAEILQIAMAQKDQTEEVKENLSDEEKRLIMLEEKVQAKKQKHTTEEESDTNKIEDILISVIYEFGFSFEDVMNMNYFTLVWYYSYTSKLHVYRINQHAIGSGMVKKINTDYFTSLNKK